MQNKIIEQEKEMYNFAIDAAVRDICKKSIASTAKSKVREICTTLYLQGRTAKGKHPTYEDFTNYMKIRIDPADQAFSLYIRTRDRWTCQRCSRYFPPDDDGGRRERAGLQCSHWEGRGNQRTRFDPDNCVAFCYGCHSYFETRKGTSYREWMIERLGPKRFNLLVKKAKSHGQPVTRADKQEIASKFRKLLAKFQDE